MYDIAKKARAGMKAKAERLAGEKDRKTDSSDWSPAEPLNADVKTGMRPVSRRAYKKGGAVKGEVGKQRADRKPRKAGGPVKAAEKGEQPLVDRYVNRDLKKANEYRDGKKHVGGLKTGGRAKKTDGGGAGKTMRGPTLDPNLPMPSGYVLPADIISLKKEKERKKLTPSQNASLTSSGLKTGGRANKRGGGMLSADVKEYKKSMPDVDVMGNPTGSGMKHGGRAHKTYGGGTRRPTTQYQSMEEMIEKNPAPAKKPLGLDKVPLPPRRPENLTPAANNPIKPDMKKYMPGDVITGPPKEVRKDGGRAKKNGGGKVGDYLAKEKAHWEKVEKDRAEYSEKMNKKYPGMSAIERAEAEIKEKFSPAYFANLKKQKKQEMDKDKGYQEFAARRAKKDDDSDDANAKCYGGRAKKNNGGPMMADPRLGIVKPKAMEFGQNTVVPGLKKGGRVAKTDGGTIRQRFNKAFAEAAKAGVKDFDFEGKKYKVEFAKPNKAPVGAMPGSSRPGAPPMGAGPGSRSANVAAPAGAGPGSVAPRATYTPPRVMGTGQGASTTARPSVTTPARPDERYYEDSAPVNYGVSLGNKRGGRIAKQIGGALGKALGRGMPNAQAPAMGRPGMGGGMGRPGFGMGRPMQPPPATTMPTNPIGGGMQQIQPMQPPMATTDQGLMQQIGMGRPMQPPMATTMPNPFYPVGQTGGGQMVSQYQMPVTANTSGIGSTEGLNANQLAQIRASQPNQQGFDVVGGGMLPPMPRKSGGRVARAYGGEINNKSETKSKGKGKDTNVNILIKLDKDGQQDKSQQMGVAPSPAPMALNTPPTPMGGAPMPSPAVGGGVSPDGMMPPMPRKAGGRVSKVAKSYKDMTAGTGSGEGRLQKTDIAKRAPHKAGGKVYRSYKNMDAGAGSGKGRLEKTEIQSRKK